MKIRAIIVLFVLCIGIYNIYGDLEVKQIAHSEYSPIIPSIYGDKIVWVSLAEDTRGLETDIYLYDISKDEKRKICDNCCCSEAVIYGDKIVWADHGMSESDRGIAMFKSRIYLYDLTKEKKIRITDAPGRQDSPRIYKNKIVYIKEYRDAFTDPEIYLYDLSTGKEKELIKCPGIKNMDFHGDKIVWERELWKEKEGVWTGYLGHDIYLYDLSTGREKRITNDSIDQYNPKIYGDKIIWEEELKEFLGQFEYRLCLYDLSTNKKKIITSGPSSAAIYKDKIVYSIYKNGKSGVFLYDISTGEEKVVTYDYWGISAMYENTIVWLCAEGSSFMPSSSMYFCNIDEASLLPPTTVPPTTNPATTLPPTTQPPATTTPPQIPPFSLSQSQFFKYLILIASIFLVGLTISILIIRQKPRKKEKTTKERPKEIKVHKGEKVESLELKRLLKERDRLKALLDRLKSQKEELISKGMPEEKYNKMYNQAIEKLKTIEGLILLEEKSK